MEKMVFVFNDKKARELGYSAQACYDAVDTLFAQYGDYKVSEGVYIGDNSQNAYTAFGVAQRLPDDTDWFLKTIETWKASDDDGEHEDCLDVYYRVKARNA